ncbi:MAG: TraR/DksA C4-type zinc finger protein [Candidatus Nanopelagicales bacterium]
MVTAPEQVRLRLAEKQAEIEAQLADITDQARTASAGIGFGKRVGDGTSAAVERFASVAVHDRLTAMLADITRARAKLDEGSYGRCDVCDGAIPEERLEALPWATVCVEDAP